VEIRSQFPTSQHESQLMIGIRTRWQRTIIWRMAVAAYEEMNCRKAILEKRSTFSSVILGSTDLSAMGKCSATIEI
jgi:hypothetical protein